jgi:hypothetical protein
MNEEIYRKNEEGEFELVGREFNGFPSNGIWVVENGLNNCVYQFKNVSDIPTPSLVSYMQYQDELTKYINNVWDDKPLSMNDVATVACEFFALKAGGMKVNDTIIEN